MVVISALGDVMGVATDMSFYRMTELGGLRLKVRTTIWPY